MRYTARSPLRIDFAGGWTDVPVYALEEGGAVLNAAITRYTTGSISRPDSSGFARVLRGDRSYLDYRLDLPSGAGLGASAAQTVLWVTLVKCSIANVSERAEIAEIAWNIGQMLGILGGKQDEYASALGGIQFLTFTDSVHSVRLELESSLRDEFARRCVLVYSGERRLSGALHESVWESYRGGGRGITEALAGMKRLAHSMRDVLLEGRLSDLGPLLTEHWSYQKALDPCISNPHLDDIFAFAVRHGASGGKACGAGGGGCLLFFAAEGQTERLRSAFSARGMPPIDFSFDTYGVYLRKG